MNTEPARSRTNSKASIVPLSQNAALQGAAMAFGKPGVKPKPDSTYRNNGALAAATKADSDSQSGSRALSVNHTGSQMGDERLQRQQTGGSDISHKGVSELGLVRQRLNQLVKAEPDRLQPPGVAADRSRSPSQIAASLAASRSAPTSPNRIIQSPSTSPFAQRQDLRPQSLTRPLDYPKYEVEEALDTTPIPPTTSLIGMFEKTSTSTPPPPKKPKAKPKPVMIVSSPPPEIKSPKPVRMQTIFPASDPVKPPQPKFKASPKLSAPSKSPPIQAKSSPNTDSKDDEGASSDDSFVSATDFRPAPPPARKSAQRPKSSSATSSYKTSETATISAMADAIVASSLASSRAASPAKQTLDVPRPIPPPRRGSRNTTSLFHNYHHVQDLRTPSPAKQMRTTMRKPPKEDDEEDANMARVGKRNLMKKHPNKHHEGDRKRWRDTVTERERKRYEAVWASNKGLYLANSTPAPQLPPQVATHFSGSSTVSNNRSEDASFGVLNIIVRDIWARSRLGDDILAEVWDLVDRSGRGWLSREEFVAGMWLVDQRLKGRKLPIRVGDSVWGSIGGLGGVKVRGKALGKGKRGR